MAHLSPRRRPRRESGQVLPLVAAALMVLTGFAGVTVDLGHQYVTKRQLQAAADAAALAGAAGLIFGLYYNFTSFLVGYTAGLRAFTAAVFGGIGNIPGAALGGLLIGIIAALNDGYFDSAWTEIVIFAILILTLVFRPTGLLGMRVPEK